MPKRKQSSTKLLIPKEEQRLLESAANVKKENKQVDFKALFDPTITHEWCQIIKDILAMANTGGGIILFGVDDDGKPVKGFEKSIILNIDPATISDKIFSYTGEHFSDIRIVEVVRQGVSVPAFLIDSALTPIVFTKPGADVLEGNKQRPAFVRGSVYFRHGAKSEPGNTNDIRAALEKALNRTKKSWFEGVRKISNIKDGDEIIVQKGIVASQSKIIQHIPVRIVSDKGAQSFRPDNAAELWPHRSKEIVKKVNEALPEGIKISTHDVLCIKKQYGINEDTKPDLVYRPYKEIAPRYSEAFVEWILKLLQDNQNIFTEAKAAYKTKS
jgi:hypothetical protein